MSYIVLLLWTIWKYIQEISFVRDQYSVSIWCRDGSPTGQCRPRKSRNDFVRHRQQPCEPLNAFRECPMTTPKLTSFSYSKIKKKLSFEQVVTRKCIRRSNIDSMVTNITKQMCIKLGRAPWLPMIPETRVMALGFEVCIDSMNKRRHLAALVETMEWNQLIKV